MTPAELLATTDALVQAASAHITTDSVRPHADEILARYEEVDAKLVAADFPPTSPWWRASFEDWYRSGRRQLVVRAGRRAGKSSSFSRLGVVEMLYGKHKVPPGDFGVFAIVSTDKQEAAARLTTVTAILDTLGVKYTPWGDGAIGIKLVGKRVGCRVYTASIKGVSGFTAIFILADEVAKWADKDSGANPAKEVLKSIRPTMRTQRNARIALSSSPFGVLDAHYDAYEAGETPQQVVAHAPTWIANPTVTEQETRDDEPDEATWEREYAAIPQAEIEEGLLTEMLVDRAMRKDPLDLPREPGHYYAACLDPATRGNAWTLAVATRGPDRKRRIVLAREWRGTRSIPLVSKNVMKEIKILLKPYGLTWLTSDQWAGDPLKDDARECGLTLSLEPWTSSSKREAYEGLKTMLLDEELELPPDDAVKNDLLGIKKKLTRNGVTYELATQGPRHSDYAPAIAMVAKKVKGIAKVEAPEKTVQEQHDANKAKFLTDLQKDRQRTERFGPVPATHRRMR